MLAWPCVLGQNFMTMGAYGRESSSSHCGQERERQDVLGDKETLRILPQGHPSSL